MTSLAPPARPSFRPWTFARLQRLLPRTLVLILLTFVAIISLFPLYWLFVTALTPASATVKLPPDLIPVNLTFANFADVVLRSGMGRLRLFNPDQFIRMPRLYLWFINTAFISIFSTGVHILFDSMAAYAFAKKKFPGSNLFFWMILAALMIPGQVTLVPLYLMITKLKWVNTFTGVIAPGLADVIGIFLLAVSFWVGRRLPLPVHGGSSLVVPGAISAILTGLFLITSRRQAVMQVLGYLVMENGIAAFGLAVVPEIPLLIELGILLDVFVGVFVMAIAIWHISHEFDNINTDQLSTLKG